MEAQAAQAVAAPVAVLEGRALQVTEATVFRASESTEVVVAGVEVRMARAVLAETAVEARVARVVPPPPQVRPVPQVPSTSAVVAAVAAAAV